jgi:hypothetical protein
MAPPYPIKKDKKTSKVPAILVSADPPDAILNVTMYV